MLIIPSFNYATMSSARYDKNLYTWMPCCKHAEGFVAGLIEKVEIPYWEAKWQELCAKLFTERTEHYTEPQRVELWRKLGRDPEHIPPATPPASSCT